MLNPDLHLNHEIFTHNVETKSTRDGFGEGLLAAGRKNPQIVALSADLTESTRVHKFAKEFPERYIQCGIAEQNMAGVAAGLALSGKIPFITSHAAFSPGRNWDQIRVSICMNKANVKIIGSHSGFSYGRDGATANSLEDISLMRVLPEMTVIYPIDALQTSKAVEAASQHSGPVYIRVAKEATPLITTDKTPFHIGKSQILVTGNHLTLISSGPIVLEALLAAKELVSKHSISTEVIALPTIKPLDEKTILESAEKSKNIITIDEHQIIGGIGSAISELLSEKLASRTKYNFKRIGVKDTFSESGSYSELKDKYQISAHHIVKEALFMLKA